MRRAEHFDTDHLKGDLRRRTARGSLFTFSAQAVRATVQLIAIAVLARMLAPEDFGLVAMVSVVIAVLMPLNGQTLGMSTIQRDQSNQNQVSSLFWINAALGLSLMLVLCLSAPLIAGFYNESRIVPIIYVLSAMLLIHALAVQSTALLQRQMRFETIATVDIIALILGLISAITAALLGYGLWALVLLQLTPLLVQLVIVFVVSGWIPTVPRAFAGVGSMLRFGANYAAANFCWAFHDNVLPFLIGRSAGASVLGFYNRAYAIVSIPNSQVLPPLFNVLNASFSRMSGDQTQLKSVMLKTVLCTALVSSLLTTLTFVSADLLVLLFFGEGWDGAIVYVQVLAFLILVQPATGVLTSSVLAAGRSDLVFRSKLINVVLTIAAVCIALPYGPVWMTIAYVACGLLAREPIFVWMASRVIGFRLADIRDVAVPMLSASLVSGVAAHFTRGVLSTPLAWLELLATCGAGGVCYVLTALVFSNVRSIFHEVASIAQSLSMRQTGMAE